MLQWYTNHSVQYAEQLNCIVLIDWSTYDSLSSKRENNFDIQCGDVYGRFCHQITTWNSVG